MEHNQHITIIMSYLGCILIGLLKIGNGTMKEKPAWVYPDCFIDHYAIEQTTLDLVMCRLLGDLVVMDHSGTSDHYLVEM